MSGLFDNVTQGLEGKSADEKVRAIRAAFDQMTPAEKEPFAKALAPVLKPPGDPTNDRIWLVVIWAFVLVLVGSAAVLGLNVFYHPTQSEKATKPEIVLSVFTAVAGFLAGLLSPSPFGGKPTPTPNP